MKEKEQFQRKKKPNNSNPTKRREKEKGRKIRMKERKYKIQMDKMAFIRKICVHIFVSKFGFFVKWHINLCDLCNAEAILAEGQSWYYLTHYLGDKEVHTFPKGIRSKVNVKAQLDTELTMLLLLNAWITTSQGLLPWEQII